MKETKELPATHEKASGGLVRIFWVAPTGECGNGDPLPRSVAEAFVEQANRDWTEIQHWIGDA